VPVVDAVGWAGKTATGQDGRVQRSNMDWRRDKASRYREGMESCAVCGSGLPEVSVRLGDPFCSRACAQESYGTGTRAERRRASRQQLERAIEDGTDPWSMELRRVTVDDRQKLIAEGRYWTEFSRAFREYLIAQRDPKHIDNVTWFSPRYSGPIMRRFEEDDPGNDLRQDRIAGVAPQ
jgi:hypothetical protein